MHQVGSATRAVIRASARRSCICALLLLALAPLSRAQAEDSVIIPIVFPATTQTTPRPSSCFFRPRQILVPGPDGADTGFDQGDFINVNGETLYAIDDSDPFCSNTIDIEFLDTLGRPATRFPSAFAAEIANLGALDDLIECVVIDDDIIPSIVTQLVPAGGRATFIAQGSHISAVGFASAIHDQDFAFPSLFGIASLTITQPAGATLRLMAQNITSGATAEVKAISAPVTASIPLGARFTLSLQHIGPPFQPIVTNFGLGTASLENAQQDPTLYPASVLLEFNASASEATKTFQAMHLGTQTVVMTPDDNTIPRQVVTVQVVKPSTLGTTHQTVTDGSASFDLDAKIIEWADKRGIPPQLIKGIMDRESGSLFTPKEWRYEPLTTDWDNFAPPCPTLGLPGACQNKRARLLYAPYRMEYDASHPRGALLVDSEDVHPRSVYYSDFANRIRFADSQQLVTTYAIVSQNTSWQNWIKILGSHAKQLLLTPALIQQTLSWPANTTLASSYGLMQVLFEESFANYGYAGIAGQRRPYYLFDVPANVAAGAGSIPVGSGHYVFEYRYENNFDDLGDYSPQYDTTAKLDDDYQNGLMGYNGEHCQTITAQKQCYGPDTMNRIKVYLPIAATAILP